MKRGLLIPIAFCLAWLISPNLATAASPTATYTGGGWTLTLHFQQTSYGQIMSGAFHSAHQSFQVHGDWIPAADQGSDLLRFYGHPFGQKKLTGLVGLATLSNTCIPYCAASKRYKLAALSLYPGTKAKLPGVGRPALILQLHM